MLQSLTPSDYEQLIRLIHERYDKMSKSYQRIALYLTQNPNDVAVLSVTAIAERCSVHASSVVRFAQALGYDGFKTLQDLFQKRLSTAAPGFEARIKALESELDARKDRSEARFLQDLVVRDIASLQSLLMEIAESDLTKAVTLLENAEVVYLIGQLRSSPVVELLRYILTMLGKRCVLLDPSGGLATHMSRAIRQTDALVAISFRFYATEVVNIVNEVAGRKVPVVGISDSTLSPIAKAATVLFSVPEHEYTFSRSLAAPMCLAQALTVALAARLQKNSINPRIPTVTGQ
jgi:DNA-binding MurR/RpiR family transcriptional regulator